MTLQKHEVFCLLVSLSATAASGAVPATVTLSSSATGSATGVPRYGQSLTLTATVSPTAATGTVTFYDDVAVLETEPLTKGQATFTTNLLPAGAHAVRAYYGGDSQYAPALSAVLKQSVTVIPGGAFRTLEASGLGGPSELPAGVAVGDFNGDGRADLAVAEDNAGLSPSAVSVLLGNGDGSFQPAVNYATAYGSLAVALGDFNGDGATDMAVANSIGSVSILLGNGDGSFKAAVTFFVDSGLASVVIADFNGDGKADLALICASNYEVNILSGNGDGTFEAPVRYSVGYSPAGAIAGDFNGDGNADLAIANSEGNNVSILLGYGDGTFTPAVNYGVGFNPYALAAGDFNNDGISDLAVANFDHGVSILIGNGDGTFKPALALTFGVEIAFVAVGDFNGDGALDLVAADLLGNNVDVLFGKGDGTFLSPLTVVQSAHPYSIAVGEFNGDGRADMVISNEGTANVTVLLGTVPAAPVCAYSVTGASSTVAATGGSVSVAVQTGSGCAWFASGLPGWITVSGSNSATGSASVTLVAAVNTGAPRSAQFFVADSFVTITQLSSVLSVAQGGALNAASYSSVLARGSLASVFGNFLVDGSLSASSLPLPTSLAGVSVQFFGAPPAPLIFLSAFQANVQVPWEASEAGVSVTALLNGQSSVSQPATITDYSPAIFAINGAGYGQGAILNSNYKLVDASNPVTAGSSYVQIYATGLGPVTNQPATGSPALSNPLSETADVTVEIGGASAIVLFAGLAPGTVGEYQINALVPSGSRTGPAVPVQVTANGIPSNTVTMAIQ